MVIVLDLIENLHIKVFLTFPKNKGLLH